MKYLVIANKGETDYRAFTMLGVSSAREETESIGQFGSGAKHGILVALRAGLELTITTGNTVIIPFVREEMINKKLYSQLCFEIDDDVECSSMTLDFGSLDWEVDLLAMFREFVSNALDQTGQNWDDVDIFIEDGITKEEGKTKVYIELRHDVAVSYRKIEELFLHAKGIEKKRMMKIEGKRSAKIYRKGVFVADSEAEQSAMYDYNFGDDLKIDEARKLDGYDLHTKAARVIFSDEKDNTALKEILRAGINQHRDVWEHHVRYWAMDDKMIADAVREIWGEDVVIADTTLMMQRAAAKGVQNVIFFPPHMCSWYDAAKAMRIKTVSEVLGEAACRFKNIEEIECTQLIHDLCDFIVREGFARKTIEMPKVFTFRGIMAGGAFTAGYCNKEGIFLAHDHIDNIQTILEELAHWFTGFNDCTRDLQDWAFNVSSFFLKERLNA